MVCLFLCFGLIEACKPTVENHASSKNKASKQENNDFAKALNKAAQYYTAHLQAAFISLDSLQADADSATLVAGFQRSRKHFKLVEPLLWATDKENYLRLNGPNLLMVDEEDATAIKKLEPFGYQVLEELLAEKPFPRETFTKVQKLTVNRLQFIHHNAHLRMKPHNVLWMWRDAIVRIATMGITGFDSPVFANSLAESRWVYQSIDSLVHFFQPQFSNQALRQQWQQSIKNAQLQLAADFDSFDRYRFIKECVHPQLALWVETANDWKVDFPFALAMQNNATSLFTDSTFNINYFADYHQDNASKAKAALGRKLFHDVRLSSKQHMSCATCHQADKAFTDGLANFPQQKRNTPTLLYAGLQQGFFYDKRAGSLEGQIVKVVENANEFHTNLEHVENVVMSDTSYESAFNQLYDKADNNAIRHALATYIRTLAPFNSPFDRNINNEENTLSRQAIKGFNLFMGKASCATCHFPPVFNGTVPPAFKESELEHLGVPARGEDSTQIDEDLGRYHVFETPERQHFFKTPTVRNISATGPYMHNGVYDNLWQVMHFYQNGGGNGMGMKQAYQTLPDANLQLTPEEMAAIIVFMRSLIDGDVQEMEMATTSKR